MCAHEPDRGERRAAFAGGPAAGALICVLASLLLLGCVASIRAGRPDPMPGGALRVSEARAARCPRSPGGAGRTYREDLPGAVDDPALRRLLAPLSAQARRTALAAGVQPLLGALLRERERAGGAPTLEQLTSRQELDEVLASLQPQLLAMEFEAECVIALMTETLGEHEDEQDAQELGLTVASLVVGAVSGLGAGIWDLTGTESNGPVIVGIAGAGVTTALGVAALVPRRGEIVFTHRHNLLAPIWRGEDPEHLYPTFVFRLLTLPRAAGAPTPRDELVATWRELLDDTLDADDRATAEAILWGEGGTYDAELLALHRRLLEELEATLDSFARDVDLLAGSVRRLLRRHAAPEPGTPAPAVTPAPTPAAP